MIDRQKRLIEVYGHLRESCGIHTKTQFAEKLGYGRTSLSAAMNGKTEYLTDSLFQNICNRWPDIFNIDYLLNGDGTLLSDVCTNQTNVPEVVPNPPAQEPIDHSSLVNALIAAKDETIEALRNELKAKNQLIAYLTEEIHSNDRFDNYSDRPLMASEDIKPYNR